LRLIRTAHFGLARAQNLRIEVEEFAVLCICVRIVRVPETSTIVVVFAEVAAECKSRRRLEEEIAHVERRDAYVIGAQTAAYDNSFDMLYTEAEDDAYSDEVSVR
jgi:hypothetical protein